MALLSRNDISGSRTTRLPVMAMTPFVTIIEPWSTDGTPFAPRWGCRDTQVSAIASFGPSA